MKDFTAIISSCKFGTISIVEANKLINEQIDNKAGEGFMPQSRKFKKFAEDEGWFYNDKKLMWEKYNGSDESGAIFKYATDKELYDMFKKVS